jgi:hypothetical protein
MAALGERNIAISAKTANSDALMFNPRKQTLSENNNLKPARLVPGHQTTPETKNAFRSLSLAMQRAWDGR